MSSTSLPPQQQSIVHDGTSRWEPTGYADLPTIPRVTAANVAPIIPDMDLWDSWPLAHEDGRTVVHGERVWWFFLSSPVLPDPAKRHDQARIRLASLGRDGWRDHGPAFPDGLTPGSREWAGSAVLGDDGVTVTVYFTVAGRRGASPSFEQRLFACDGVLQEEGIGQWQTPREIVAADGACYVLDRQDSGLAGQIKGFRDPAWFRDPATGTAHILFTGSAAWSEHAFNGIVGMAWRDASGNWALGNPVIEAVGVNNELERPHILLRAGRYYLFWSTQRHTFAPEVTAGPNGLYAMVADSMAGPWHAVNGSGLVAANPADEPTQTYSWWVTAEGTVWSFVDYWGMEGRLLAEHPELVRSQFGGTAAPVFQLAFDGDRVTIAT